MLQKRLFSVFTGGLIQSGESEKRPRQQEASGKTFEVVTPPIVSSEGESEGAEQKIQHILQKCTNIPQILQSC